MSTGGFPGVASGKEPTCQCGRRRRHGFDPWIGKIPCGGHDNPLQYPCLENPMDRRAWQGMYGSWGLKELEMTEAI